MKFACDTCMEFFASIMGAPCPKCGDELKVVEE